MTEVIAEMGINFNGDMEIAKKMIDVAYAAGIDYVKFQKRDIDLVYTKEELDKPRESPWGTTTREQKQGLEFNRTQYCQIDDYCREKDIAWFASVWDRKSADFILNFHSVPLMKIPSALITDLELLDCCANHPHWRPIILSTGMSTLDMVDKAIDVIGMNKIYCIMHCTSTYPTDISEMNMKCVPNLREKYPWTKIGFSNHYPGLMGMVMALNYDADMLEFHMTLDRASYGSDQAASIEPQGVFKLLEYKCLIESMKGNGIKEIYKSELPIMAKLRR